MNGRDGIRCKRRCDDDAALLCHLEVASEQRLCGGRTQANQHFGLDQRNLALEPRQARSDLARRGLLVDPSLAVRFPFEMLHRIGDVSRRPIDAGRFECLIEKPAGRPYEWMPAQVLVVARLFPNEHYARRKLSFAKDRLRCILVQRAAATSGGRFAQRGEVCRRRNEQQRRQLGVGFVVITSRLRDHPAIVER